MLEAEAALLLALRRRATPTGLALKAEADRLLASLPFVYVAGRRYSRELAADVTASELESLDRTVGGGSPFRTATIPDDYERWRSRRAARGYAGSWLDEAERAASLGLDDAAQVAYDQQLWRLEMGAATEAAEAHTLERERALRRWANDRPWAESQLFKVWDATLDKRTCNTCSQAHGTVVRLRDSFPAGRPGGVHPRCRCTFQILTLDEVDLDYLAAA